MILPIWWLIITIIILFGQYLECCTFPRSLEQAVAILPAADFAGPANLQNIKIKLQHARF